MGINERITVIRKNAQKNKAEFAALLNISPSLVTMLENGTRELTNRTAADICEKFNVNKEWLETGEGEPYKETVDSTLKLLKAEYDLDELDLKIVEMYMRLSPIERQVFKDYIKKIKGAD